MKFSILLIFFLLISCSYNYTKFENRSPYNSKGFAYIYKKSDFENKLIKGNLENSKLQVSHKDLKVNTLLKITNIKNKKSLTIKNTKKINYPDFYKILITKRVANDLSLDINSPLVEIIEIKKNKSFIAKKAKIFNEEKRISSNAPVTSVKIDNISKNKDTRKKKNIDDFFILIGTFYSQETAEFLKKRIKLELPSYNAKKLKIVKKSNKEINLISGPYRTINFIKNDYIQLKAFGFEELNIITNE